MDTPRAYAADGRGQAYMFTLSDGHAGDQRAIESFASDMNMDFRSNRRATKTDVLQVYTKSAARLLIFDIIDGIHIFSGIQPNPSGLQRSERLPHDLYPGARGPPR